MRTILIWQQWTWAAWVTWKLQITGRAWELMKLSVAWNTCSFKIWILLPKPEVLKESPETLKSKVLLREWSPGNHPSGSLNLE